jgi:hypothetical protein
MAAMDLPLLLPAPAPVAVSRGVEIVTTFLEIWPDEVVLGLAPAEFDAVDAFDDFWGWSRYELSDDLGSAYGPVSGVGVGGAAVMSTGPGPPPGSRTLTVSVIARGGPRTDLVVDLRAGAHVPGSPALAPPPAGVPRVVPSGAVLAMLPRGPAVVGCLVLWPQLSLVRLRYPATRGYVEPDREWTTEQIVDRIRHPGPFVELDDGCGTGFTADGYECAGTWRYGGGLTVAAPGVSPAASRLRITLPSYRGEPGGSAVVDLGGTAGA